MRIAPTPPRPTQIKYPVPLGCREYRGKIEIPNEKVLPILLILYAE
jgi:hypothetical protein